ncbi:MAG: hypothetical protein ACK5Z5_00610 [Neisseriaceae bacterium]
MSSDINMNTSSYKPSVDKNNLNWMDKLNLNSVEGAKPRLAVSEDAANAVLLTIAPEISDGYQPPFSDKYKDNNSIDQEVFNAILNNVGVVALDLLPIFKAQQNALKIMFEVQNSLTLVLDSISKNLIDYAKTMSDFLDKEHEIQMEQLRKNSLKAAIASFVFGVVEAVLGVAMMVTSGGLGSAVGGFMLFNGLAKLGAGIKGMADPDAVRKGSLYSIMQNGVFAMLGSAAGMTQQIMSILMLVGGSAEGLLKLVSNLSMKTGALLTFNLANLGTSTYGMISGIIDTNNTDNTDVEKMQENQIKQVATMGVMALITYEILKESGLTDKIKEKSEVGAMIFEMTVLSGVSIGFTIAAHSYAADLELPSFLENSNFRAKANDFMRYVSIENSFNQASTGIQLAIKSHGVMKIETEQALIDLKQQIGKLMQKILQEQYSSMQQLISDSFTKNGQEIAKRINEFTKNLNNIVMRDANLLN